MDEELKLINEIDRKLDEIVASFILFFNSKVQKDIKEKLEVLFDEMDFSDNSLRGRIKRQRVLIKYRNILSVAIGNGALIKGFDSLVLDYKELVSLANAYFSVLSITYKKQLYKELYKDSLAILTETLTGRGLTDKISNDIINRISKMNIQGARRTEMRKWVFNYLSKENLSTSYVSGITSDTLYMMTRIYQNKIAEDLNIKYWLYAGTLIKTSRSFCKNRTGNTYTTGQVKEWAKLEWGGKMENTTSTNIFQKLGGYNCRHTLRPISKRLYTNLNK